MIIGLDLGSSAVKAVCIKDNELVFTHYETSGEREPKAILRELVENHDIAPEDVRGIVATGLRAASWDNFCLGIPVMKVSEIEAIGRGALYLTDVHDAVIANFGTGTSFFSMNEGVCEHIIGSGVGGGTLIGLCGRGLKLTSPDTISDLASVGNLAKVDLLIGDLYSGDDVLMPELTASNLAKAHLGGNDADYAAGVVNMIVQVIGTMSVLCCKMSGHKTAIITGGTANLPYAKEHYKNLFEAVYGIEFVLPENGRFATAIGAVLYGEEQGWN